MKDPATMLAIIFFLGLLVLLVRFIRMKWIVPVRGYTQLALLVASELAFFCNKGIACQNCPLSFGVCPVGTAQRLAFIDPFPGYGTILIIGAVGIVLGTLTCGWACPVGFIQELFAAASPGRKAFRIPDQLKQGRYAAFVVMAFLILVEWRWRYFSVRGIDMLNEAVIFGGFALLALAFVIRRPFCKTLCPLGLIYGLLNKYSLVRVRLSRCRACEKCREHCVTDIQPRTQVNSDLCVKCFNCQAICNQQQK